MDDKRRAVTLFALSASAFVALAMSEGYRGTAYLPTPDDVPTIGFGTTENVSMGDTITPPQALARALNDVSKFEGALKKCVKVPLNQGEYDAYVDLAYNIGAGAFCGSTLVKKLNTEDYAGACAEISRWDKQGKKALPGLTKRRKEERAKCEGKV